MTQFNNFIIQAFFWLTPLSLLVFVSSHFKTLEQMIESPKLHGTVAAVFIFWLLCGIYFFCLLVASPSARETFLTRLANIEERDEREEQIVGRASRAAFLFTLAALIALFAASTVRYGRGTTDWPSGRYASLTVGHWDLLKTPAETIVKNVDGTEEVISLYDLSLTKSGLLLLLIAIHLSSYYFFARKRSSGSESSLAIAILISGIVMLGSSSSASAEMTHGEVSADSGLQCSTYLFMRSGASNLPLVIQMWGTGAYSNASDKLIHPALLNDYEAGKIAVLTFDKPGITPDSRAKDDGAIVDDLVFNRHTQRDLVSCAERALLWALGRTGGAPHAKVFIFGHSEGAQVGINLYKRELQGKTALASQIEALFLSGIPMKSWREILDFQLLKYPLNDRGKFWDAYDSCDEKYLREFGGTPCEYLHDAIAAEAATISLKKVWDLGPNTVFQVFQGVNDDRTTAQAVQDFELLNRQRKIDKKSYLNLHVRYYLGTHGLNQTAMFDMETIFNRSLEMLP